MQGIPSILWPTWETSTENKRLPRGAGHIGKKPMVHYLHKYCLDTINLFQVLAVGGSTAGSETGAEEGSLAGAVAASSAGAEAASSAEAGSDPPAPASSEGTEVGSSIGAETASWAGAGVASAAGAEAGADALGFLFIILFTSFWKIAKGDFSADLVGAGGVAGIFTGSSVFSAGVTSTGAASEPTGSVMGGLGRASSVLTVSVAGGSIGASSVLIGSVVGGSTVTSSVLTSSVLGS